MQLIRDVGVTHGDETRVGFYVGLMVSLSYRKCSLSSCLIYPIPSNPYFSPHRQ